MHWVHRTRQNFHSTYGSKNIFEKPISHRLNITMLSLWGKVGLLMKVFLNKILTSLDSNWIVEYNDIWIVVISILELELLTKVAIWTYVTMQCGNAKIFIIGFMNINRVSLDSARCPEFIELFKIFIVHMVRKIFSKNLSPIDLTLQC